MIRLARRIEDVCDLVVGETYQFVCYGIYMVGMLENVNHSVDPPRVYFSRISFVGPHGIDGWHDSGSVPWDMLKIWEVGEIS